MLGSVFGEEHLGLHQRGQAGLSRGLRAALVQADLAMNWGDSSGDGGPDGPWRPGYG